MSQSQNKKTYLTNLDEKIKHKQLLDTITVNDEYTDLAEAIIIPEKKYTRIERMIDDKRKAFKFKHWQFKRNYAEANRFLENKINIPFILFIVVIMLIFGYFYITLTMSHNQITPTVIPMDYSNIVDKPAPVVVMIDKPRIIVQDKSKVDSKLPEVISITPTAIVTVTPLPVVILPMNTPHIDQNDFITEEGLNSNYNLIPNQHIKGWSNYTLNLKLQNLKDTNVHNINVVVTACQYSFDSINNRPNVGNGYTLYNDNIDVNMKKNDIITYDKSVYIPNYTGQYVLIVNLYADNGGKITINQIITIGD